MTQRKHQPSRRVQRSEAPKTVRLAFQDEAAGKRAADWRLVAPLLAFVAIIAFCETRSVDLGWHLKTGEWIWQHRAVPSADPFSYTAAGQPWIAHEWLFGVVVFLVNQAAGLTGLIVMKSLFVAGLLALAAWVAREREASAGVTVLVLAAAYAVARLRFTERPELISLPVAVAFLLVYEKSRLRPRIILLLPVLQLLWTNIHGGTALLGWALCGAFVIDRAWQSHRARSGRLTTLFHRDHLWHWGAFAGVIAVSFANPTTYRTLAYGLLRVRSPLNIQEFQSLGANAALGFNLAIGLFIAYAVALAALFVLRPRSVRLYEWLLLPALLLLAVYFFRFRSLFVFLLAPALARQLSQGKWLGRLRWWPPVLAAVVLLARIAAIEHNSYTYRFGAGVHPGVLPVEAAEFIRNSRLSGRMFNSYGFGGYFIWKLWPEVPVFIDGREDVYVAAGVAGDYLDCFESAGRWQALVSKYGIDFAVIDYPEKPPASPDSSLEVIAFPRSAWALVYFDDMAVIFVRRNGRNEEVIKQYEIRFVQPLQLSSYLDAITENPATRQLFLEELDANLRRYPGSFRNHFFLGLFAAREGADLASAIREFQLASTLNPEYVPALLNLGSTYMTLGRLADAREAYRKVMGIEDNDLAARQLKLLQQTR